MSKVAKVALVVTTGTNASGTATSGFPLTGRITEVRLPAGATALTSGSTASFTITRGGDGGTVLAVTSQSAPFQYQPRQFIHTVAGANGTILAGGGIPVDDYITCVVAAGGTSVSGTVFVHYEYGG